MWVKKKNQSSILRTSLSLFGREVLRTMVMQELNLKKFMAKIALEHYTEFQVSFTSLKPLAKLTAMNQGREIPKDVNKGQHCKRALI